MSEKAPKRPMVKRSRTKSRELKTSGMQNQATHEMCLIYADFKHFCEPETKEFLLPRKVSSIMRAKVLSIMRASDLRLTSLFKPIRTGLGYGLTYRPGT